MLNSFPNWPRGSRQVYLSGSTCPQLSDHRPGYEIALPQHTASRDGDVRREQEKKMRTFLEPLVTVAYSYRRSGAARPFAAQFSLQNFSAVRFFTNQLCAAQRRDHLRKNTRAFSRNKSCKGNHSQTKPACRRNNSLICHCSPPARFFATFPMPPKRFMSPFSRCPSLPTYQFI